MLPFLAAIGLLACVALSDVARAQVLESHRAAADRLIDAALRDSSAHQRLSVLVDRFGHRLSGSQSLEDAIDWIVSELRKQGFDNVHTEPVKVTNWQRDRKSVV